MKKTETKLKGVFIIEPDIFGDHRGWFAETYNKKKLAELGISGDFVQDNHSMSAQKGTLRGLHCQKEPAAQDKLVRCTKGAVLDVAVDIREGSPTFRQWIGVELTAENGKQLYIPKGFAHGFVTLSDNAEIQYKVTDYYSPENDRSIRFDDPEFCIDWGTDEPILSDKDKNAPLFKDSDVKFQYKE